MKFKTNPLDYYRLVVNLKKKAEYKSGQIKLIDINNKLIFPIIKLPNIIFSSVKKESIKLISDLNNLTSFIVYFQNTYSKLLNIQVNNLECVINLISITKPIFLKSINFIEMRNRMDFTFTDYYINRYFLSSCDKSIVSSSRAYSKLLLNPECIDEELNTLKVVIEPVINVKKKVRVLYLIDMSPQYESIGYTVRTHDLLKHVQKTQDVQITGCTRVCYPWDRGETYFNKHTVADNYERDGVTYVKLLEGNNTISSYNILTYIKMYIIRVVRLAHKLRINVIHAATDYFNGITAYYAAKFLGIKSIYEVRGFWEESSVAYNPYVFNSDMVNLRSKMEDFVCSRVDCVLTINEGLAKEIKRRSGRDADIICNGVDLEVVKPDEEIRDKLRYDHGIMNDYECTVIGYIGSLLVYEGLSLLLEAISRIQNVKFVFAGKGPEKDKLLQLVKKLNISDRVVYLGVLSHSDSIKYYNMMDIIVYPRKDLDVCRSTSSSKLFEAMAMKKALLVSDLPAYREVIVDNVNGMLCKPEDLNDLIDKLSRLICEDKLRYNMGNNAREYIIKHRGWSKMAEKLEDIYKKIIYL